MIQISENKIKQIIINILNKINNNLLNKSISDLDIDKLVKNEFKLLNNNMPIFEGIKYNIHTREVEYSDSEESVNTSVKDNPTVDTSIIPGIEVWSIFQRKNTPYIRYTDNKDGNPLLYAFKNEDNWHFKSEKDKKKFITLFEKIAKKFLQNYQSDITIVMPSGSILNMFITNIILRYNKKTNIVTDLLRKLTVDEVWETLDNFDSPFRKKFGKTQKSWDDTLVDMNLAFEKMRKMRNGKFTYHFLPSNKPYREYITKSLACDDYSRGKCADKLYNHNILLIDDSISRGNSIKEACSILNTFQPKSITVLTMFSKKK